jgi:hypothetical protein
MRGDGEVDVDAMRRGGEGRRRDEGGRGGTSTR